MSYYDDLIKRRKENDQDLFSESFQEMAGIIDGDKLDKALKREKENTHSAIRQILKYYHIRKQEIPELDDIEETLEYVMRPHGLMRCKVKLEKGWYKEAYGAMLTTKKEDGSPVALFPAGIGNYVYYDSKTKLYRRIGKKNEDMFDSEAISFYPSFPLRKLRKRDLISFILKQVDASDMICMILALASITGIGMLLPWLKNVFFGDVLSTGNRNLFIGATIFLLAVTISKNMAWSVRDVISARITSKIDVVVNAATLSRVLSLPPAFFRDYNSGELSSRERCMAKIGKDLVRSILSVLLTAIMSLAYIGQIIKYAPSLLFTGIIVIILSLVLTIITVLVEMKVAKKRMLAESKENGLSYQIISGIQKIKLSGAEKRAFNKWSNMYTKEAKLEFNPPFFIKISPVLVLAISEIGYMVMDIVAINNHVTVSDYYSFCAAYGSLFGAFMALSDVAKTLAGISPKMNMVKPILDAVPEISEDKEVISDVPGNIEINNVSFRYSENDRYILDNLSLKIKHGEYVAIVGKSGCGKSTLIRLMLGFEKPETGAIYYNNLDVNNVDLRSLRRKLGVVLQNGKMFSGDIYSNISISAPKLTMEEAWEAAEIAGIADDIRKMPMGMRTQISDGEGGISGGQRQRILIARAIAPKPHVLFLDEATSALDNVTQKKVSDAMDKLKCTRIVIAHRLSTIKNCDRILVMDKGHIIEDGNFDELMNKNGFFAELVKRQQVDVA